MPAWALQGCKLETAPRPQSLDDADALASEAVVQGKQGQLREPRHLLAALKMDEGGVKDDMEFVLRCTFQQKKIDS